MKKSTGHRPEAPPPPPPGIGPPPHTDTPAPQQFKKYPRSEKSKRALAAAAKQEEQQKAQAALWEKHRSAKAYSPDRNDSHNWSDDDIRPSSPSTAEKETAKAKQEAEAQRQATARKAAFDKILKSAAKAYDASVIASVRSQRELSPVRTTPIGTPIHTIRQANKPRSPRRTPTVPITTTTVDPSTLPRPATLPPQQLNSQPYYSPSTLPHDLRAKLKFSPKQNIPMQPRRQPSPTTAAPSKPDSPQSKPFGHPVASREQGTPFRVRFHAEPVQLPQSNSPRRKKAPSPVQPQTAPPAAATTFRAPSPPPCMLTPQTPVLTPVSRQQSAKPQPAQQFEAPQQPSPPQNAYATPPRQPSPQQNAYATPPRTRSPSPQANHEVNSPSPQTPAKSRARYQREKLQHTIKNGNFYALQQLLLEDDKSLRDKIIVDDIWQEVITLAPSCPKTHAISFAHTVLTMVTLYQCDITDLLKSPDADNVKKFKKKKHEEKYAKEYSFTHKMTNHQLRSLIILLKRQQDRVDTDKWQKKYRKLWSDRYSLKGNIENVIKDYSSKSKKNTHPKRHHKEFARVNILQKLDSQPENAEHLAVWLLEKLVERLASHASFKLGGSFARRILFCVNHLMDKAELLATATQTALPETPNPN